MLCEADAELAWGCWHKCHTNNHFGRIDVSAYHRGGTMVENLSSMYCVMPKLEQGMLEGHDNRKGGLVSKLLCGEFECWVNHFV